QTCCDCGKRKYCVADYLIGKRLKNAEQFQIRNSSHRPDETVFCQGQRINALFFVKSGSVKNVYTDEDGEQQILGFHFSGEIVDPISLQHANHLSSLITLENTLLCAFPLHLVQEGCDKLPTFSVHIRNRSEAESRQRHETLLSINRRGALDRLAAFLLDMSLRQNLVHDNSASLRLPMTRADIANYLGLAPETVSRTFSKFKEQGLILAQKKYIRINDIEKLAHFCN
ncbi:MAG: Crp/Fnr family transcriptional regulator, partial [Methylomonas sp.]|nr:Crp/Fnr family transcriptional regulator [Methylomonas sp.]